MRWAEKVLKSGEVLTYFCSSYPKAWKHKLKHSAPPALWSKGAPPPPKETLAIVGSRNIDEEAQRFAYQCAYHAVQKGFTVCSGAAIGTDSWAAYGAVEATKQEDCPTPLIEILPYGVRHIKKHYPAYRLSTCAPSATFSSQQAMERNTLIYASARLAVVVQPRWRQGGSWHGALNALQRRLTAVTIFGDPTDPGTSELLAKGASLIHHPPEIEVLLKNLSHQPPLFEAP
jgi:predicted Rossmann fold nucleotide-binding protein DprA/Smf involved in DNA uptake